MKITIGDFLLGYACLVALVAILLVAANWRIERRKREGEGEQ